MDDLTALLSNEDCLRCRFCRQWLSPMHGTVQRDEAFHPLSPRGIRIAIEEIADGNANTSFECHDCEKRRKVKKAIFWIALGGIAVAALLYGEFRSGRL